MADGGINLPFLILLVGVVIVLVILVHSGLKRLNIPSMVGYVLIGFLLRVVDLQFHFLSGAALEIFEFLAKLGVIMLLFRIGLKSNISGLLKQLRSASIIWIADVLVSGTLGFVAAYHLLKAGLIPSIYVAIAMTATSIGISVSVWHEAEAIQSKRGELLIDIAELDDISGIFLMALLVTLGPTLERSTDIQLFSVFLKETGMLVIKLLIFGGFCVLLSLYAEQHITRFFQKFTPPPNLMLVVTGIGIIMAAFAGLLGFSVAIGAFFAGLVFSRDPQSVQIDDSFNPIYELFSPFFFIGIGINIDPGILSSAIGIGLLLLIVAILGKLIGDGLPSLLKGGWISFSLIGFSMVPRAEISLIVMKKGLELGKWAVPPEIFTGMVIVSLATCLFSPMAIHALLQKWPQTSQEKKA